MMGNKDPNEKVNKIQMEPLLVDAVTAAGLLSISEKNLWKRTKSGEIPHRRVGCRVLYSPTRLREWADGGNNSTTTDQ